MPTIEIPPTYTTGHPVRSDRLYGAAYAQIPPPVLLIQLKDDLARSRRREAFWLSFILHALALTIVVNMPRLMPRDTQVNLYTPRDLVAQKHFTYLELPPDTQEVTKQAPTDVLSDKNRIASSPQPAADTQPPPKVMVATTPGPHASLPARSKPLRVAREVRHASTRTIVPPHIVIRTDAAQLAPPPAPIPAPPLASATAPPANSIQFPAAATADSPVLSGSTGDYGASQPVATGDHVSAVDVVSDTMGVNFGPYLSRVLHVVRTNWYDHIPDAARAPLMKKGRVSVEFTILKNGHIAALKLAGTSGDPTLDRAAVGSITAASPFPTLPGEFHGPYLGLRVHFFYNPDTTAMR